MQRQERKRLGDLLMEAGLISKEQLDSALELQKTTGRKLGVLLASEGIVTQEDIMRVLEEQMGISHVSLEKYSINSAVCNLIPEKLARRYELIPIDQQDGVLTVAMSDPLNVFAIDDIEVYTGMEVVPVIDSSWAIKYAIDKYYVRQHDLEEPAKKDGILIKIEDESVDKEIIEADNEPTAKLVNSIIEQAIRSQSSDIHIEPSANALKVRFRTDGLMHEVMNVEMDMMSSIAARIKTICRMSIAERRVPQEGRVAISVDEKNYDLKVSILPTIFGEKIAIRIEDNKASIFPKEQLGLNQEDLVRFERMIKSPQGIVLVTGPAGSGKTTTLYTAINEINSPNIHIITIEDPVESTIEGVNHVQVNIRSGLTCAKGLRTILKQGPDVIMIGEIKDVETVEIAVRSAISGHLVLAAIRADSAPSAVIKLMGMGIEPFSIAASLAGVISQRLVRKICPVCKKVHVATDEELSILELDIPVELYSGDGCEACGGTGYKGRLGVFEVMGVTKSLRELINDRCTEEELRKLAIAKGMKTLKENAKMLVLEGETTVEEMIRLLFPAEE